MKSKKGISETITIILFVLIAIAAVAVVWAVLKGSFKSSTDEVASQSACLGINLDIVSATATDDKVTVTRGSGGGAITNLTFMVAGKVELPSLPLSIANLTAGETSVATFADLILVKDKKVEVTAKVGNTVCPVADTETVV